MASCLYLGALQARHSHEDVVEVGAAPPQHVHPHLVALLPQLVDGIFRAGREWAVRKTNKAAAKNLLLGWNMRANLYLGSNRKLGIFILLLKQDLRVHCSHWAAQSKGGRIY